MILTTQRTDTKAYLLSKVSQLDIIKSFCSNYRGVGVKFYSPILVNGKSNDSSPSAIIYCKGDTAVIYDHRVGKSFGAIDFAMLMTGLSYADTIDYLMKKFIGNNILPTIARSNIDVDHRHDEPSKIYVKYSDWNEEKLLFWTEFGWLPFMLDQASIHPIEKCTISINDRYYSIESSKINSMMFCYDFGDINGLKIRKIYSPFADKAIKWRSNTSKNIIQGLNTLTTERIETLYITSSLKDCGPFWRLNGYPCAVAPVAEGTILMPHQIRFLRQISNNQIIWYDNDQVGIDNAKKHANLYGMAYSYNPMGSPKDPSDYVKQRGLNEFNKLLNFKL